MMGRDFTEVVTDEDLSAFADGRLPPARSARVAAHLRADPAAAERVFSYWRHEADLLEALGGASAAGVSAPPPPPQRGGAFYAGIAAAILACAMVLPWLWNRDQGLALYPPETSQVGVEVAADTAPTFASLESPAEVDKALAVADVAEFHFTAADGTTLALYSVPMDSFGPGALPQGEVALVEWVDDGRHFALGGNLASAEMLATAVLLRRQLSGARNISQGVESPLLREQKPVTEDPVPAGVSTM